MIRILHYIGLLEFGGSQSFVMELYRKIDKSKIQFDFVTFPNQKDGFYKEIIDMGGMVYECPQYNGKNHFKFIKWWKDFFAFHKEYKVSHIHVRSVASLIIPIIHKFGGYAIVHSHSISNGRNFSAIIKKIMQLPIRYKADYMLACSEEAGKWLYGKNIVKKDNYKVIKNSIDAKRFSYDENKRDIVRQELKIEDKFVLGHVGRMTEPKNHKFLLRVFAKVLKERENAVLLLVGDGELKEEIEKEARDMQIHQNIIFAGNRSNTEDYYQAMDVFIFPSLWEGLGIVLIEAQVSGLPCIISERIPQEVDYGTGLIRILNLDDDIKNWSDAIINCGISKRSSRLEATIEAGYDISSNVAEMEQIYYSMYENER